MQNQIQAAGLPWFEADDYASFRAVLPDRRWHASFREWEAAAQENLERIKDQGIRAIKAKVRSADFVAWCRATGRDINSEALAAFGAEAALRDIKGEHWKHHANSSPSSARRQISVALAKLWPSCTVTTHPESGAESRGIRQPSCVSRKCFADRSHEAGWLSFPWAAWFAPAEFQTKPMHSRQPLGPDL